MRVLNDRCVLSVNHANHKGLPSGSSETPKTSETSAIPKQGDPSCCAFKQSLGYCLNSPCPTESCFLPWLLVLGGVGISNSSAVKQTFFALAGNSDLAASTRTPAGAITVHAAGRGKPFLNLQDGREMSVNYRGDQRAVAALQNGAAQARSLAAADFDRRIMRIATGRKPPASYC